jgi:hypothetical protein
MNKILMKILSTKKMSCSSFILQYPFSIIHIQLTNISIYYSEYKQTQNKETHLVCILNN